MLMEFFTGGNFFCFFRFGDSSFFYDHGVFGTKLVWREVFERTTLRPCVPLALDDCIQITGSGKITFKVRVSWDPLLPCSPSKAADFTHLSPLPPCAGDYIIQKRGEETIKRTSHALGTRKALGKFPQYMKNILFVSPDASAHFSCLLFSLCLGYSKMFHFLKLFGSA